jgi:hypothetical protein
VAPLLALLPAVAVAVQEALLLLHRPVLLLVPLRVVGRSTTLLFVPLIATTPFILPPTTETATVAAVVRCLSYLTSTGHISKPRQQQTLNVTPTDRTSSGSSSSSGGCSYFKSRMRAVCGRKLPQPQPQPVITSFSIVSWTPLRP